MDAWQRLIRQKREGRGREGTGVAVEIWSWALACKRDLLQIVQRLRADLSEAAVESPKIFPVVGNLAAMPTTSGRIARYRGTQNTDNSPQKNALWCCCPTNSPEEDR